MTPGCVEMLKEFRDAKVSLTQAIALGIIARDGTANPSKLSKEIGICAAGLTNMFDKLERLGLIETCVPANDRRGRMATLTQKGRDLLS